MTLIFGCACGETFEEADYHEYAMYRQIVNVHRERCTRARRATEDEAHDEHCAVTYGHRTCTCIPTDADPCAQSPRTGRPATGVEPTPAPPVATHVERTRLAFGLLVGRPALAVARLRARFLTWPFEPHDFT